MLRLYTPKLTIRFPYTAPFECCLFFLSWVGRVVPNPPFADRHMQLDRVPILSLFNGGLGEPRPTSCLPCPLVNLPSGQLVFRSGQLAH